MNPNSKTNFSQIPKELYAHFLEQSDPETRIATRQTCKGLHEAGLDNFTWYNLGKSHFDYSQIYDPNMNYRNYFYYLKEATSIKEPHNWNCYAEYNYSSYNPDMDYEQVSLNNRYWHEQVNLLHCDECDIYDIDYLSTINYRKFYYMKKLLIVFLNPFHNSKISYEPSKQYMELKFPQYQNVHLLSPVVFYLLNFENLYKKFELYFYSGHITDLIVVDYAITEFILHVLQQYQANDVQLNNLDSKFAEFLRNLINLESRKKLSLLQIDTIIDIHTFCEQIISKVKLQQDQHFLRNTIYLLQKRNFSYCFNTRMKTYQNYKNYPNNLLS
jgi:hypothetical protein